MSLKLADAILQYNYESCEAWRVKGIASEKLNRPKKAKFSLANAEKYIKKPISLLEE